MTEITTSLGASEWGEVTREEDEAFEQLARRLEESEAEKAALVDENKTLRRLIGDLAA